MRRRALITLLGGAAVWPLAARAQQPIRRVAVLMPYLEGDPEIQARLVALREGLLKLGWTEGENIRIEIRWPADNIARIRSDAEALMERQPDLFLVGGRRAVPVFQQMTRSIPIVFVGVSDPIESGLVTNLARPGANATGFALLEFSIIGKMVESLKETVPKLKRLALVLNPEHPAAPFYSEYFVRAATALDLQNRILFVRTASEIESGISEFAKEPNCGLVFPPDITVQIHTPLVVSLVTDNRLPAIYYNRPFVVAGGLMSYGANVPDLFRRAASYVDRILRSEKPGDLPVQFPTKFDLAINLKTARALGLEIPPTLLARAMR